MDTEAGREGKGGRRGRAGFTCRLPEGRPKQAMRVEPTKGRSAPGALVKDPMYPILPVKATLSQQNARRGTNGKPPPAPRGNLGLDLAAGASASGTISCFVLDFKKRASLVVETHPVKKLKLTLLSSPNLLNSSLRSRSSQVLPRFPTHTFVPGTSPMVYLS